MKRLVFATLALTFAVIVSCGRALDDDKGPLKALNLSTGDVKEFSSPGEVPAGWAPCSDPSCGSVPPSVPCANLGEAVCTLNPQCRLKKLWCQGSSGTVPGWPGGGSGGSEPTDPSCPAVTPPSPDFCPDGNIEPVVDQNGCTKGYSCVKPPEEECVYACLPKAPLLCEELTNEKDCAARTDCEWGPGVCPAIACAPGTPCPPCPSMCQAKAPPTCQELDEQSCKARSDCSWGATVCPACAEADGTPCECKSFCQPNDPTPSPPPTDPSDPTDPTPAPPPTTPEPVCKVTGCSGTVCSATDVATTCEWAEWYACYKQAVCEQQANGTCGWTETPGFTSCMQQKKP